MGPAHVTSLGIPETKMCYCFHTSLPIESNPIAETQTGPSQLVSPPLTPLLKGKHYNQFCAVL